MDAHLLALSSSPSFWRPGLVALAVLAGVGLVGGLTIFLPLLLGRVAKTEPRRSYFRRMLTSLWLLVAGLLGFALLWVVVVWFALGALEQPRGLPIGFALCLLALWAGLTWGLGRGAPYQAVSVRRRGLLALATVAIVLATVASQMALLSRARTLAKGSMDHNNLRGIAWALETYHQQHGVYPDDLRRLVDASLIGVGGLTPPLGGSRPPKTVKAGEPYDGPVDYRYVPLPADAPGELIHVWRAAPESYGPGGWGLYRDGEVYWHEPEELLEALGRTRQWMEDREGP